MTEKDMELQELRRKLKAYEDTGLTPDAISGLCEMDKRSRMAKMLRWEEAEKDGRLVVLPCKLGTRIYKVQSECDCDRYRCERCLVGYGYETQCAYWDDKGQNCTNTISLKKNGVYYEIVSRRFSLYMVYNFGKTIFLTREEAEKALK